jgi:hypothetical protein
MTTIKYYVPKEQEFLEVTVYDINAGTMIHQLQASDLRVVEVVQ